MSKATLSPRQKYPPTRHRALSKAFGPLARETIFTVWRWGAERNGKLTKVPTHPAGKAGVTFAKALALFKADSTLAGLGVKLGPVPNAKNKLTLFGVDYDGAAKGPLPQHWPKTGTYTERSPSGGDKFHVLGTYEGEPLEGKRKGAVEIYTKGRFFTLTGERINGAAILPTDPRPFYAAIGIANPQPYGAQAVAAVRGAPIAEADLTPRERTLLEAVRGIEDQDESKRDFAVCAELVARGATDEQAARVLSAGFWRAKLARADYISRTLAAARKVTPEAAKAFRDESKAIGEGIESSARPVLYDLPTMLAEAVFIKEGSQVALRYDPRLAWSLADFENATAASTKNTGKKGRPANVAGLWLRHPQRATVDTRTFKAGGALFCRSPNDMDAINTWREPPRTPPPANWRERAKPFLDHVAYLVPARADRDFLLDWLAHIEQAPGVLPHVHVLMFTPRQGVGRNWLSSVAARVWAGAVALDVDLPALLDGGFNGRLSRKVLAVVNEIREGGSNAYRHADRLRTLLTDEQRHINPKYGREYDEFNAARWIMFSNHEGALPLDRFDRRVYAIANPGEPRGADYYTKLYALAGDCEFIASVREALRVRDISRFNPGMHAPLTAAKQKVIEASMSDAELEMQDVVANHPSDCITADALGTRLFGSLQIERAALRHIAPRAGAQKYPGGKVRVDGQQHRIWVLRNHARWMAASAREIAQEVRKKGAKRAE